MNIRCHNFLKKLEYFHHINFINEKIDLQVLNIREKVMTIWINRIRWCASYQIFYIASGAQRIFLHKWQQSPLFLSPSSSSSSKPSLSKVSYDNFRILCIRDSFLFIISLSNILIFFYLDLLFIIWIIYNLSDWSKHQPTSMRSNLYYIY